MQIVDLTENMPSKYRPNIYFRYYYFIQPFIHSWIKLILVSLQHHLVLSFINVWYVQVVYNMCIQHQIIFKVDLSYNIFMAHIFKILFI